MDGYLSNWSSDQNFINLFNEFNSIHGIDNNINTSLYARLHVLRQLAFQQSKKDACFAEAGIFAGMSVFFTADACNTKFICIDSFDGVSEPTEFDTEYFKENKIKAPLEVAEKTLSRFKNIEIHKGWIPEVLSTIEEDVYSFVHIDVDMYEPTKNSIEYFWQRVIPGGVLVCDDYGSPKTPGARKAMNDFFGKDNILELPTGQGIIFKGIDLV